MTDPRQQLDIARRLEQVQVTERPNIAIPFSPYENLTSPFTTNGNPFIAPITRTLTPIKFAIVVFVATTNDATKFWTITLNTLFGAGGATTQCTLNTSAIAANSWQLLSATTFTTAQWLSGSIDLAFISVGQTSTPGSLAVAPILYVG